MGLLRYCCALFFLFAGVVQAANPLQGFYVGLIIGPGFSSDLKFNVINPLTLEPVVGQLSYQTSLSGGGQLGYRYYKFRFEGQALFNQSKFKKLQMDDVVFLAEPSLEQFSIAGNTKFSAVLINAYYELYRQNIGSKWLPYLGIGAGYAHVKNSIHFFYEQDELTGREKNTSVPVGQAMIGINYLFSESFTAGIDYRVITTPNEPILKSHLTLQTINYVINLSFD